MWWKKERTLRTFILRDQVAHGMQALAPTCQLGSVSTHRSAWALPVVDVNNGNEATQVNSGWTPADAYQPVTLSRCLDDFGWRHFFATNIPRHWIFVEKLLVQCKLHLQHVRKRVRLQAVPPWLTLLGHQGIRLQSARRVSTHVVPVRVRRNTAGTDATVPVLSDRMQGILASVGAC